MNDAEEETTTTTDLPPTSNRSWTDAALDFVEEVTKTAQCVTLYAKILDYTTGNDGRPIPMIELWDTNDPVKEVNIAECIVGAGHAVWCRE